MNSEDRKRYALLNRIFFIILLPIIGPWSIGEMIWRRIKRKT